MSVSLNYQTALDCWNALIAFFIEQEKFIGFPKVEGREGVGLWTEEYPPLKSEQESEQEPEQGHFVASIWTTSDILYTIIQHMQWWKKPNGEASPANTRQSNLVDKGVKALLKVNEVREKELKDRLRPIREELDCLQKTLIRHSLEDKPYLGAFGRSFLRNYISLFNEVNHLSVFPRAIPLKAEKLVATGRASYLSSAAALQALCSYLELDEPENNDIKNQVIAVVNKIATYFMKHIEVRSFGEAILLYDKLRGTGGTGCPDDTNNPQTPHTAQITEIQDIKSLVYQVKNDGGYFVNVTITGLVPLHKVPDVGSFIQKETSIFSGWTVEYHRVWFKSDIDDLMPDSMATLFVLQGLSFLLPLKDGFNGRQQELIGLLKEVLRKVNPYLTAELTKKSNKNKSYDYFCRRLVSLVLICQNIRKYIETISKDKHGEHGLLNEIVTPTEENIASLYDALLEKIINIVEKRGMRYVRDPLVVSGLSGLDIVQLSGADLSMVSHALLLTFNYFEENKSAKLSEEMLKKYKAKEKVIPSILRKLVDALENQLYFCESGHPAKGGCRWTDEDLCEYDEPSGIYLWNSAYAARAFSLYLKYSSRKDVKGSEVPIAAVVVVEEDELNRKEEEKRKLRALSLRYKAQLYSVTIGFLITIGLSPGLFPNFFKKPLFFIDKFIWSTFLIVMIFCFVQFLRLWRSPSGFNELEDLITDEDTMKRMKKILFRNYFWGIGIFIMFFIAGTMGASYTKEIHLLNIIFEKGLSYLGLIPLIVILIGIFLNQKPWWINVLERSKTESVDWAWVKCLFFPLGRKFKRHLNNLFNQHL